MAGLEVAKAVENHPPLPDRRDEFRRPFVASVVGLPEAAAPIGSAKLDVAKGHAIEFEKVAHAANLRRFETNQGKDQSNMRRRALARALALRISRFRVG